MNTDLLMAISCGLLALGCLYKSFGTAGRKP